MEHPARSHQCYVLNDEVRSDLLTALGMLRGWAQENLTTIRIVRGYLEAELI